MTTVRVATTAAGTLATSFENGDTIDGIVLATGDLILIKNQAAGTENGVYIVEAAGSPTRAHPFRSGVDIAGEFVYATEGTVNVDTGWLCTNAVGSATIGTDALVFEKTIDTPAFSTDSTDTLTNKTITDSTNTVHAALFRTTGAAVSFSASAAPAASGYVLETTAGSATIAEWEQRFQIFMAYSSVDTDISAGFTAIPWNVEKRKDSVYTHTAASSDITVGETADYLIIADLTVHLDAVGGLNLQESTGRLMVDTGGGFTELTGSRAGANHTSNNLVENSAINITWVESLSSGDIIRVEAQRDAGAQRLFTLTNFCRIFMMKL